ncbi:hypothetical protein Tco_1207964, partial [Tanacetum coccineum]
MTNSKCPEIAQRFADRVPRTVTEMMKRVYDFIKSKEAYKSTELSKGEHPERGQRVPFRGGMPPRLGHENGHQRMDNYVYTSYGTPTVATSRPPMVTTLKKENLDRYCDYHGKKGHYSNDYYHLKRQLEAVLESGKLNHLVKDVRQRGNNRGRQSGNNNGRGKVINMVQEG